MIAIFSNLNYKIIILRVIMNVESDTKLLLTANSQSLPFGTACLYQKTSYLYYSSDHMIVSFDRLSNCLF